MRSKVSWVYRVCCGLSFWPLAHRQAVPEAHFPHPCQHLSVYPVRANAVGAVNKEVLQAPPFYFITDFEHLGAYPVEKRTLERGIRACHLNDACTYSYD